MFGCIRKLGCLLLILVGVVAWLTRDRWLHYTRSTPAEAPVTIVWEPLTEEGSRRARVAVNTLGRASGPVFVNLPPGDLASFVFTGIARQLPPSAQNVRAAVIGDKLYVKALVALKDFGGPQALGGLGGFLAERDTVTFGGNFEIVRPGLAQFRVSELKLGGLAIPQRMLPRMVSTIRRGAQVEGVTTDGLPLEIPRYVGDVRVARGRITLYKTVP